MHSSFDGKDIKNASEDTSEPGSEDLTPFPRIRLEGDTLFAVLKRTMQLTGIRIPDCAVQDIRTVKELLAALQEKPKATKLAQVLAVNEQLTKLPNVQLMATRYTPISKEKENGRWKVIVKELKERDLPITGTLPPSEIEEMLQSEVSPPKREQLRRHLTG